MTFPQLSEQFRLGRLAPPTGKARIVLDTDTYNEIDDQFALVYSLLSPEKLSVEAIYAAPFYNDRSSGPADGMEKSFEEILRLLDFLGRSAQGFAFRGSTAYLGRERQAQDNDAVRDMIDKALASPDDDPLYVVAIGAITNVASAVIVGAGDHQEDRGGLVRRKSSKLAAYARVQSKAGCARDTGRA